MALGGGTFTSHNKVLPGSYINFVSAARASAVLSERGIAAMALELDWGPEDQVITLEAADFPKEALGLFGYDAGSEKLKGLRELFKHSKTAHLYRLNAGAKATSDYATAKYAGVRGNDLRLVVAEQPGQAGKLEVSTYLGTNKVDVQLVEEMSQLQPNDFVTFIASAELEATAGMPLTGGTNGSAASATEYQRFLDLMESHSFHTLGCISTVSEIQDLFVQFTRHMRNEVGTKFQTVLYRKAADFEGIINVDTAAEGNPADLVYWTTGLAAGCPINRSNTNAKYDGELTVKADYKQSELEEGIKAGKWMLHKVGNEIRVLEDNNSLVTFTEQQNGDFANNQMIRVMDQMANDIAVLFNTKYLGKVQNNASGRVSFWNEVVKLHQEMEKLGAIEDFKADDVEVEQGDSKKSVIVNNRINIVNTMSQLYMTTLVQ